MIDARTIPDCVVCRRASCLAPAACRTELAAMLDRVAARTIRTGTRRNTDR